MIQMVNSVSSSMIWDVPGPKPCSVQIYHLRNAGSGLTSYTLGKMTLVTTELMTLLPLHTKQLSRVGITHPYSGSCRETSPSKEPGMAKCQYALMSWLRLDLECWSDVDACRSTCT